MIRTPAGATRTAACNNARLEECARRLPQIATMSTGFTLSLTIRVDCRQSQLQLESARVSERKVSISDDRREDQGAGRLAGGKALPAPPNDSANPTPRGSDS